MYACLHHTGCPEENSTALVELAYTFSPAIEIVDTRTVVFSIAGLHKLIGEPAQIAAEIARRGAERRITANLAIAATPDTAILAARNLPGVTLIPPGREVDQLGSIPLERLALPAPLLETLRLWGLRTLGDLAALPLEGLSERLGQTAVELYQQVHGRVHRPLRLERPHPSYTAEWEFEDPLYTLEPLLLILGQLLQELCHRLQASFLATNQLTLELDLERGQRYRRSWDLPAPQAESKPLWKLLQLTLEAHPPAAPIRRVRLWLRPVKPQAVQEDLFHPPAPEPQKLQLLLARLASLVGEDRVGAPELLNTHRPDAFALRPFVPPRMSLEGTSSPAEETGIPPVGFRRFRPPLEARVSLRRSQPCHVAARGITGMVIEAAGPWRSSGDWWTQTPWARDEWDVALSSGGTYRIYCELASGKWFVEGAYD